MNNIKVKELIQILETKDEDYEVIIDSGYPEEIKEVIDGYEEYGGDKTIIISA